MDWEWISDILEKHSGYEGLHQDEFPAAAKDIAEEIDKIKGGGKDEKKT